MNGLIDCSIQQLIPASAGWNARYRLGNQTLHRPVALWALLDAQDGARRIVGIAPDDGGELSCHAEEAEGFERYVYLPPATTTARGV